MGILIKYQIPNCPRGNRALRCRELCWSVHTRTYRKNQSHNVCRRQVEWRKRWTPPNRPLTGYSPSLPCEDHYAPEALLSTTWSLFSCLTALRRTAMLTLMDVGPYHLSLCVEVYVNFWPTGNVMKEIKYEIFNQIILYYHSDILILTDLRQIIFTQNKCQELRKTELKCIWLRCM
jgi:hypothetical protein